MQTESMPELVKANDLFHSTFNLFPLFALYISMTGMGSV